MDFVLEELKLGSPVVEACMRAIIKANLTLLVTGDTGAGKTATARALAHEAGFHQRILTLESTRELGLDTFSDRHGDIPVLESREANVEGQGAVTLGDLVQHTLRLHPSRVWMGEILGAGEVAALLNMLATGHRGSLATLHGFSAEGALLRLQSLCQQPPNNYSEGAANSLIASAVDFVVHLGVDHIEEDGGRIVRFERYVSEIIEVGGCPDGRVEVNPIFKPGADGRAEPYHPLSSDLHRRLAKVGYHHRAVTG